jgi:cob(I)alamin adenosyltransferase
MLIINTGNGKGKTTAAMGQILRALGHKQRVCLIQLFKGKDFYGEQKVLRTLKNLDYYSYASKHPFCFKDKSSKTLKNVKIECSKALFKLYSVLKGKKHYDLIVLDEFNIALRDGFIILKDILELLSHNTYKTNIIITGRSAPKELIKIADLVTEMKEIKHPFSKGLKARKGIEW